MFICVFFWFILNVYSIVWFFVLCKNVIIGLFWNCVFSIIVFFCVSVMFLCCCCSNCCVMFSVDFVWLFCILMVSGNWFLGIGSMGLLDIEKFVLCEVVFYGIGVWYGLCFLIVGFFILLVGMLLVCVWVKLSLFLLYSYLLFGSDVYKVSSCLIIVLWYGVGILCVSWVVKCGKLWLFSVLFSLLFGDNCMFLLIMFFSWFVGG